MPGRVAGKVAFVTGAGRGQGRSHAIRLAEEGADIIAVDILSDYATVGYGMSTQADLDETVKAVEALDRRIIASKADVRDLGALRQAVDAGVAELGKLDIVCANAGICTVQAWDEVTPAVWQDTIDTNLTGVWNTLLVSIPHLLASRSAGSIRNPYGCHGRATKSAMRVLRAFRVNASNPTRSSKAPRLRDAGSSSARWAVTP